jgi:hypothetical protein
LPQYFTDEQNGFKFVTLSFEEYKNQTISKILNHLADQIAANIENLPQQVREKADGLENFFELFLPIIIDKYFSGKKLVLLLDECDVLKEDKTTTGINVERNGKTLFYSLEKAVKQQEKLFAILVFGTPLKDIDYLEEFLHKKGQKAIEVGLLDQKGTRDLIVKPALGILEYTEDAIEKIWELSAGQPSLTQLLCSNIFYYCRGKEKKKVEKGDVDSILSKAMEQGEGVFSCFIHPLSNIQESFFRAVAEAQEIGIVNLEEINNKIIRPTKKISRSDLIQAEKRLVELGFLEKKDKGYKIKVELVRLWLLKKHALLTEKERENLMSQHGKNKPNRPRSIEVWMGSIAIIIILFFSGQNLLSRFHSSGNSERDPQDCYKLSQEIKKALKDKKDIINLEQIIDKVRNKWSREKENSLDTQCPYNYKLDAKYNEILQYYGISQMGNQKLEQGIEALCEITNKYEKFSDIETVFQRWVLTEKLDEKGKKRVFDKIIEQNQPGNNCFAYSFKDNRNKNELYDQKAQIHASDDEYDQAVESYCQITDNYYDFKVVVKQLEKWLSSEFDRPYWPYWKEDLERDKVEETLKQLTKNENECPAFPPSLDN